DHLFTKPDHDEVPEGQDYRANLNPNSLVVLNGCKLEPSLGSANAGDKFQFERLGYFCGDKDSAPGKLVFNPALTMRDTWAKIEKKKKESADFIDDTDWFSSLCHLRNLRLVGAFHGPDHRCPGAAG